MKELLKAIQEKGIILKAEEELPFSILPIMYNEISRKEITHSNIIASLLSPKLNHDYKFSVATQFLNKIGLKDFKPENVKNFKVISEESINGRFIDILITWEENSEKFAVIIENKLNNAVDQKNQLNDYYKGIKETYKIKKVVYMPINPNKSARDTDATEEVLQKTIDFSIIKLIDWLNTSIEVHGNSQSSNHLINYRDLLKHMVHKYRNIMKAEELLSQLSNNEIDKIIELSSIVSSDDWHNAKYTLIEKNIANKFNKTLFVNKYGNFAEFFFRPYKLWIGLWSYERTMELYICSYKKEASIIIENMEFTFHSYSNDKYYYYSKDIGTFNYPQNREELSSVMISILNELSQYEDKLEI